MQEFQGIAVSPGVATGKALVVDTEGMHIPRRFIARGTVEAELARLDTAIAAAGEELEGYRVAVALQLGDQYASIFAAHLQLLRDAHLLSEIQQSIRERLFSPEHAVRRALQRFARVFSQLGDAGGMADRAHDIVDIEKRLLRHLLGCRREELAHLDEPVIVVAHNLTPSETANLNREFVLAFATEIGGPGSHTAIVAEGLQIPAVVGTGSLLTDVTGGETIIIDGDQGRVIVEPDAQTVARYRRDAEEHRTLAVQLESIRDLPAETRDGVAIELMGNIEFPIEVTICQDRGGDGIGLYRTEFLYLGVETEPDEEVHYEAYAAVLKAMHRDEQPLPVVIRTLDLGADKLPSLPSPEDERNPFLGLRSIRLSLRNLDLFRTQLRAILRASVHGDARIMFPLISRAAELRQAKMVLADVMEDLEEHRIDFNANIPVGMMVEVPSAVVMLDRFIDEVDFLSIGTNDLIQYTLAVDRSNRDVAEMYTAADPAVLRLVHQVIQTGTKHDVPVNVCGQMSGSTTFTMLLIGMGLRCFSVPPATIPEVKKLCRSVTVPQCQAVAEKALSMDSAANIKSFLIGERDKHVPELH